MAHKPKRIQSAKPNHGKKEEQQAPQPVKTKPTKPVKRRLTAIVTGVEAEQAKQAKQNAGESSAKELSIGKTTASPNLVDYQDMVDLLSSFDEMTSNDNHVQVEESQDIEGKKLHLPQSQVSS